MERNKELNGQLNVLSSERLELERISVEYRERIESETTDMVDLQNQRTNLEIQLCEMLQDWRGQRIRERQVMQELIETRIELDRATKLYPIPGGQHDFV